MRCPGQDRRYWTEDAVFEVPCPECGRSVELFKDETSARCTGCGHRFRNPGIDFGCAQWCALAEQCLGLVPEREADSRSKEGALAGVLIQRLSEIFAADVPRLARSLKVYHYAKELVPKLPADPRTTLAAALLSGLCVPSPDESQNATADGSDQAQQILQEMGVDENTIARVHEILVCQETGRTPDGVEFQIVRDAQMLDTLAAQVLTAEASELAASIETQLITEPAKVWAEKWTKRGAKDEGMTNDATPHDEEMKNPE